MSSKVDDIARLRLQRYMTRGPGAKRAKVQPKPTVEKLRTEIARVSKRKPKKRKAKR
jgi:hypothetical protein